MKVIKQGKILLKVDEFSESGVKAEELHGGNHILHKEYEFQPMKIMAKSG